MEPNTKKLFHETRRSHRNVLRAVRNDDIPAMRKELHALYDPFNSPLVEVTEGPCKRAFVPIADGLMLASYKDLPQARIELLDNVHKIGHTFGLSADEITLLEMASNAARAHDVPAMNAHLKSAGFCESGMCMPSAM